jgi:hypothetical protein
VTSRLKVGDVPRWFARAWNKRERETITCKHLSFITNGIVLIMLCNVGRKSDWITYGESPIYLDDRPRRPCCDV